MIEFERVVMSQDWHPRTLLRVTGGSAPGRHVDAVRQADPLAGPLRPRDERVRHSRRVFPTSSSASPAPIQPRARPLRPSFHVRVSLDPTSHVAPRSPARLPRSTRDVLPSTVKTPFGCRRHTFDVASVPGASTVSRLARVSTPSDSPIILDTRPSPTAPDFTRTSPFPSVRW